MSNNKYGYAKDNNYAFFNNEVIIGAEPSTFEVLHFPYSRDNNDVYCGTLPMRLGHNQVKTFKVTNEDNYATAKLQRLHIPSHRLGDILQRMGKGHEDGPGYLSTHPPTRERVERLRDR